MNQKIMLTREGLDKIKEELLNLSAKKDRLIRKIEEVSQPGEFGEDVLVIQLKQELEFISGKADSLEEVVKTARLISQKPANGQVSLGNKVTIQSEATTRQFQVVSHLEANPADNKISDQSPLGQALLGRKVGEKINLEAPAGKISYKITAIA